MKDPYSILGLDKSASKEELESKYKELKAVYSEGRFQAGAEGMKAARNLNDLENAWLDICEDLRARETTAKFSVSTEKPASAQSETAEEKVESIELKAEEVKTESTEKDALAYADSLIKEKKYDEAQRILDDVGDRNAEWHYLQSRIYYNREWISECKKHLEIAVNTDPSNEKYKRTLDKLNQIIGNKDANPEQLHTDDPKYQAEQQNMNAGNSLLNCCSTYCLMSLCCDLCCRC
jgi:thioredoxin-like negative regulator of GroEL